MLTPNKTQTPFTKYNHQRALADQLNAANLDEFKGLAQDVLGALHSRIGHGPLDIQYVSRALNIPTQTIEHVLLTEGNSFSKILNAIRQCYAFECLLKKSKTAKEISTELGYSSHKLFIIEFTEWTGLSPEVFRRLYKGYV